MQVHEAVAAPILNLSESECIAAAKNYTLTVANIRGTAPCNVWNYCASPTGSCRYTFPNGTSQVSSINADTRGGPFCSLGYSNAVDNNEYVQPAYIAGLGLGSAGLHSSAAVLLLGSQRLESPCLAVTSCVSCPVIL